MHGRLRLIGFATAMLLVIASVSAFADPKVELKVPAFGQQAYPNFAVLQIPASGYDTLEVWIQDALAEIQLASVRIQLNGMPMTPFVSVNPVPSGIRTIVKLNATLSQDYAIRREEENVVTIEAQDASKVTYRGRFYINVQANATKPTLASVRTAPTREIESPALKVPPSVRFTSAWPSKTKDRVLSLAAEVADAGGIARVIIEVNGKDVEEIEMQNERPIRKRDGFIARGSLAGEVSGDARTIALRIPIELGKTITVVAIRAEGLSGLRTRVDRLVTKE